MTDLLTRLESATEGQERELLMEAFDTLYPVSNEWTVQQILAIGDVEFSFFNKLDAHAWTSAAEMLLPEGQDEYDITTMYGIARVSLFINPVGTFYGTHPGGAKFVWATLAAACVEARG